MKKLLFTLALCLTAGGAMAQQEEQGQQTQPEQGVLTAGQPFEGELEIETYENYSEYLQRMGNSLYFNGVHKLKIILKGSKVHVIDETTGCHVIANDGTPAGSSESNEPATPAKRGRGAGLLGGNKSKVNSGNDSGMSYIHFCDLTKTGLDFGTNINAMRVFLNQKDLNISNSNAPITSYTFAPTSTKKTILDKECVLYQGDINRKMGGMDQNYEVKAWVSDIVAPAGFKWALYCLETPGIPLKYSYKYDGGHVSVMNVGELSMYYEADVTKITPREVSDSEFEVPADYKISKGAKNAFALMNYYKGIKKQLVKAGIKGAPNETKSSGVHYQTNDEWDF